MILYFTGTGNSAFVAHGLAERLDEACVCLNRYLKEGLSPVFESDRPYVIVAPIYVWRFPRIIEELISSAEFRGSNKIYCVGTMASETGDADRFLSRLIREKGLQYLGFRGVEMPNNFIIGGSMPTADQVDQTLKKAFPAMDEIARIILTEQTLFKTDKTRFSGLMSGTVNEGFNKYFLSRQRFAAEDTCTGCGLCVRNCPVNNISLRDSKPVFGNKCLSCYACIHNCPNKALNIGRMTQKHARYTCPEYPNNRK